MIGKYGLTGLSSTETIIVEIEEDGNNQGSMKTTTGVYEVQSLTKSLT
jgi:hypothetical protein